MLHKLAKFHYQTVLMCLVPKLFSKMCSVFHTWAFDDVMISEYLKFYFLKFY